MAITRDQLVYELLLDNTGDIAEDSAYNNDGYQYGTVQVTGCGTSPYAREFVNTNDSKDFAVSTIGSTTIGWPDDQRTSSNWTFSGYVKLDTAIYHHFVGFDLNGTVPTNGIYVAPSGALCRYSPDADPPGVDWYTATAQVSVGTGTWWHFTARITNGVSLDFFCNGVKVGNTVTIPDVSTLYWRNVGHQVRGPVGYIHHLDGSLDNFRAYRRALTNTEIEELFAEVYNPMEIGAAFSTSMGDDPWILKVQTASSDSIADMPATFFWVYAQDACSENVADDPFVTHIYAQEGWSDAIVDGAVLVQNHVLSVDAAFSDAIANSLPYFDFPVSNLERAYLLDNIVDEVMEDTGSDQIDGTIFGAETVAGLNGFGTALFFNNANGGSIPTDYALFDEFTMGVGTEYTISVFLKLNSTASQVICGWYYPSFPDTPYSGIKVSPTGYVELVIFGVATWYSTAQVNRATGQWFHLALKKNWYEWEFFIDGVKLGNTLTEVYSYQSKYNILGARCPEGTGYTDHLNGCIDQFRIYHRLLSNNEITRLAEEFLLNVTTQNAASISIGDDAFWAYAARADPAISDSICDGVVLTQYVSVTPIDAKSDSIGDDVAFDPIVVQGFISDIITDGVVLTEFTVLTVSAAFSDSIVNTIRPRSLPSRNGLQLEYLMEQIDDDSLMDTSGLDRHGTIVGATQCEGYWPVNHGLEFLNADDPPGLPPTDYVTLPAVLSYMEWTVSAFVRLNITTWHFLAGLVYDEAQNPYEGIYASPDGDYSRFTWATMDTPIVWYSATAHVEPDVEQWFHFAVRRTATNSLDYFCNGVKVGDTVELPGWSDEWATNFNIIGACTPDSGYLNHMNGQVDNFRLYNRALSDGEILDLAEEEEVETTVMVIIDAISDVITDEAGMDYIITQANFVAILSSPKDVIDGDWNRVCDLQSMDLLEANLWVMTTFEAHLFNGLSDEMAADFNIVGDLISLGDVLDATFVVTRTFEAELRSQLDVLDSTLGTMRLFDGDLVEQSDVLDARLIVEPVFIADLSSRDLLEATLMSGTTFTANMQEKLDELSATMFLEVRFECELVCPLDILSAEMVQPNRFQDKILEHHRWR